MPEEPAATAYPPPPAAGAYYPPQNAATQPSAANPWSSAPGVPPPPTMGAPDVHNPWASESYRFPFKLAAGKGSKRDRLSEFRAGEIVLSPAYVRVYGKAVYSEPTYSLILVASWFTISLILGYLLVEFVLRQQRDETVAWNDVDQIVLQPEKNRACLVYRLPRSPKHAFALGFKLDPMSFADFAQTATRLAPEKVRTGKILPTTPPWVWFLLIAFFVAIFAMAIFAGAGSSGPVSGP